MYDIRRLDLYTFPLHRETTPKNIPVTPSVTPAVTPAEPARALPVTPVQGDGSICKRDWCLVAVTVLSMWYGIDLDVDFVMNCYRHRRKKRRYYLGGCDGDSVYNALEFLKRNGTKKVGDVNDAGVCFLSGAMYKVKDIINMVGDSEETIQYYLSISPHVLICSFIVTDAFLKKDNWVEHSGVTMYIEENGTVPLEFVEYRYAMIIGWNKTENGIVYWIVKDMNNNVWNHASYPHNKISCPDRSVRDPPLYNYPWEDRKYNVGGAIYINGQTSPNEVNTSVTAPEQCLVVYQRENYPLTVWIIIFICIVFFLYMVLS